MKTPFADIFRNNRAHHDIAGLADMPTEPEILERHLGFLKVWLETPGEPSKEQLAQVMFVLLRIAQSEPCDGNYFWPLVANRLGVPALQVGQQKMAGEWFRKGLKCFGYEIFSEGRSYVDPILMHAGIPPVSLNGLLHMIDKWINCFGAEVPSREDLQEVANYSDPLHEHVRRLLKSGWEGATDIWNTLAGVLTASDCMSVEQSLAGLPKAIDRDTVRQFLDTSSQEVRVEGTTKGRPNPQHRRRRDEARWGTKQKAKEAKKCERCDAPAITGGRFCKKCRKLVIKEMYEAGYLKVTARA
ncbi:MAG: hypothetical protein ABR915_24375 [Thermoguttaceae bacterium]|jgi:hypothetical protein